MQYKPDSSPFLFCATAGKTKDSSLNLPLCSHDDLGNFEELPGSYFVPTYLSNRTNFPETCHGVGCGARFVYQKPTEKQQEEYPDAKWLKVTAGKPVRACKNASMDDDHTCTFALCLKCYNKKQLELMDKEEKENQAKKRKQEVMMTPKKRPRRGDPPSKSGSSIDHIAPAGRSSPRKNPNAKCFAQ